MKSHLCALEYAWWQTKSLLKNSTFFFWLVLEAVTMYFGSYRCIVFVEYLGNNIKPLSLTDYLQHLQPSKCTSVTSPECSTKQCRSITWRWLCYFGADILIFISVFLLPFSCFEIYCTKTCWVPNIWLANSHAFLEKIRNKAVAFLAMPVFCIKLIKRG